MKKPYPFLPSYDTALRYSITPKDEKYKLLIENSLSAFFLSVSEGNILETNEAAVKMFGYSSDEFKTITTKEIFDYNDQKFLAALEQYEITSCINVEATGIKKNGETFPIEFFSASFFNTCGELRNSILATNISEQKKTAKDFKQVLDSITDGFFTVDSNWVVKYWNNEVERISGIRKEEIVGKYFWDFYNNTKKTAYYSQYKKALSDKISVHFEEYYEAENIWLEVSIYPSEAGLSVFFKNITETRRLRELERIEKKVLENNAHSGSKIESTLNYYLKEIEKIHKGMICSVLKLQGNQLFSWSSPSLAKDYCAAINGTTISNNAGSCGTAAFKKEKVIVSDIEHDIRWADYKVLALKYGLRSCWSFPIINSKDQVLGTFAIYYKEIKIPSKEEEKTIERARNILEVILETKKAEELLKNSEENYRYLFNKNPSSIIIWDINDLSIIEANETAIQLYEYSREEFLQLTILDIRPRAEHAAFLELVEQLRAATFIKKIMRWQHLTKSGNNIIMEISSHKISYSGKNAVIALCNNVTEKVRLENSLLEERQIRQQQITDAVITGQEKERLELGQELHDNINQILATTKLYLECAIKQNDFSARLVNEAKILTEKSMIEIRKLSNTLLPPSLEEIGLVEALKDLIESIVSVNPLNITNDWDNFDETAVSKKLKLTIFRIVQEQLNNIIKHASAQHVKISIIKNDDAICLRIKDDGVGFDVTKKRNGVGLKNIISRSEVNNGKVSIQSKPSEGCILTILFPLI
jgi:PAS domain S-box-containing protein